MRTEDVLREAESKLREKARHFNDDQLPTYVLGLPDVMEVLRTALGDRPSPALAESIRTHDLATGEGQAMFEGRASGEPKCATCVFFSAERKNPHAVTSELHGAWDDGWGVGRVPASSEPRPENPYRTVHARMSPPGAAWDEGFAAGRAAATPDPPTLCVTADCPQPATRYVSCEGEGAYPYCAGCAEVLLRAGHETDHGPVGPAASPDERLREATPLPPDVIRLCVETHHPIDPSNYKGPIHCLAHRVRATLNPDGHECTTALYARWPEAREFVVEKLREEYVEATRAALAAADRDKPEERSDDHGLSELDMAWAVAQWLRGEGRLAREAAEWAAGRIESHFSSDDPVNDPETNT